MLSKYHKETPSLWSLWCFHSRLLAFLLFTYTSFLSSIERSGEGWDAARASFFSTSTFITTQGNLREPVRFPWSSFTPKRNQCQKLWAGKQKQNKEAINPLPFLALDVSLYVNGSKKKVETKCCNLLLPFFLGSRLQKRLDILSLIWDADDLVFSLFSPDSAISVTRKSQSKSSWSPLHQTLHWHDSSDRSREFCCWVNFFYGSNAHFVLATRCPIS